MSVIKGWLFLIKENDIRVEQRKYLAFYSVKRFNFIAVSGDSSQLYHCYACSYNVRKNKTQCNNDNNKTRNEPLT